MKLKNVAKIMISLLFVLVFTYTVPVSADDNGLMLIDSTAYYDIHHYGYGATGRALVEELTLAGPVKWLGLSAAIYDIDMNYIGTYEFTDTGYGQPTGRGSSKLLKGKSIGTIENGTCIDIYFNTYADCVAWGRRKVYIKLIKAEG